MLRRSHKKTKRGSKCEECRRRHIRCDQQRPSCLNCINSDRTCVYSLPTQRPEATETSSDSSRTPTNNSTLSPQPAPPTSLPHGGGSGEAAPWGSLPPISSLSLPASGSHLIDMSHLQLFNHFIQGTFLFIDRDTALTDQIKKTALSTAFRHPYLMHGILAFAARHISTQTLPAGVYLDQSTELQTWAVANFNPAPAAPDRDACLALFFFSSLTCMHGLADMATLDLDLLQPEPFLIRFGHYFGLHRGVRAIMSNHQGQLEESELLRVVFQWCKPNKGQGSECDGLRRLVAQSTELSPAVVEAYVFAIELLQYNLDHCGTSRWMPVQCVYLTLAWPLLVPEKLIDLLVLRRPPALIILAYYGATLDLCNDLWMVGRTGKSIVQAVSNHLGSSWAAWLHWPCEMVGIEVP